MNGTTGTEGTPTGPLSSENAVVVRIRSGMGETVRAQFLGLEAGRARVRFMKEVQGRKPESLIHPKRIIGGVPS